MGKAKSIRHSRDFRRLIEPIRSKLTNPDLIGKVFEKHQGNRAGNNFLFSCPENEGKFCVLDVASSKFHCQCGYRGRGDIFSFAMHYFGLPFGKTVSKLAGLTGTLTAGQKRRLRTKNLRKRRPVGARMVSSC